MYGTLTRIGILVAVLAVPATAEAQDPPAVTVGRALTVRLASGPTAIAAFVPRVEGYFGGGECRVREGLPMTARMVSVYYPTQRDALTTVALWYDAAGTLVRYVETRNAQPLGGRDLAGAIEAADTVASTSIQLDLPVDRALAINRGGGGAEEGVQGTVEAFSRSEPFRHVEARSAAVLATCAGAVGGGDSS